MCQSFYNSESTFGLLKTHSDQKVVFGVFNKCLVAFFLITEEKINIKIAFLNPFTKDRKRD